MFRSLCMLVTALLLMGPVAAASLDQAKASGQACEQTDGYLRAAAGAPGDIKSMVDNINAKRRAEYTKIANQNNVDVSVVGKLTAAKLIKAAPQHACR